MWNASGVTTKQIFQLDKSYGADGIVARNDIKTVADLKGKSVASSAPGTSPDSMLAWVLNKNGMSTKDVTVVESWSRTPRRRPSSPGRTMRR